VSAYLRRAALNGTYVGLGVAHLSLVGLLVTLDETEIISGIVSVGGIVPMLAAFIGGYVASRSLRRGQPRPLPTTALASGASSGLATGAVVAVLALLVDFVKPRGILINASPQLVELLFWGQGPAIGSLINVLGGAAAGALGAGLRLVSARVRRAAVTALTAVLGLALMQTFVVQILDGLSLTFVEDFLYERNGLTVPGAIVVALLFGAIGFFWSSRRAAVARRYSAMQPGQQRTARFSALGLLLVFLGTLPLFVGPFLSQTMDLVGIYVIMGLGLNIVVGFAGLLDLGYVVFYAVGAYGTAILTSPLSPAFAPMLNFWIALPLVMAIAAGIGLTIGAPVLRLRGDYLAIVTLGFGEIARIILTSQWMTPYLGGPQGILQIPAPQFFGIDLRDPARLYYPILVACVFAAIVALSLASSRVGRAWTAMREDESVAEATGVSTIKYKLLAFSLGATFGGLAGAFYAVRIGAVFPQELNLIVSINALALIILGGIGSVPGVIVGALVLVGLPELLREFSEYRLLLYGIVLVAMMLLRPEGFLPNRSRRAELHEEDEDAKDYWKDETGIQTAQPEIT
jgi:branched-chain amino acid transport system permease protein